MIELIMIELQYSGTALLLVNTHAYRIETIALRAPLTYLLSEKTMLRCLPII